MPRRWSLCPLLSLLAAACTPAAAPPKPAPVAADVPPMDDGDPGDLFTPPSNAAGAVVRPRSGPPPETPLRPPMDHGRCIRGRFCELEGFCSMDGEGQCIAATNEDCKPSAACLGGRCTAFEGRCIAANDEDCRGSWACKGYGQCHHDGDEACMAKDEVECRASTRCRREGFCKLAGGECVKP